MILHKPPSDLKVFVESIWQIDEEIYGDGIRKIVPDGSCEIIINIADPYHLSFDGTKYEQFSGIQLFFLRDRIKYLKQGRYCKATGIRLKPYSLYVLSGASMVNNVAKVSPLATLLPKLSDQILSLNRRYNHENYITEIEILLTEQFDNLNNRRNPMAEEIYEEIERKKGVTSVAYLLEKFNIGYKQCERIFLTYYGTTPKKYIRFRRLNFALNEINKAKNKPDFMLIVAKYAFHDQAHFIKEFIDLTGVSPLNLFNENDTLQKFYLTG